LISPPPCTGLVEDNIPRDDDTLEVGVEEAIHLGAVLIADRYHWVSAIL
jgi:hypothetical protein